MFKLDVQPYVRAEQIYYGVLADTGNTELAELRKQEFLYAVEKDPLLYYVPTGANEKYINTVANSTKDSNIPVVLSTYANGTGKTNSTIQIILNIILGPQNGWFDYELFRNFPFPKRVWYISNAEALKAKIIPEFERLLKSRPGICNFHKDGYPYTSRITFENNWAIYFKTYDQDPSTFESLRLGIIAFDEPAPEVIWNACKGRVDLGCLLLLPMTPLGCEPYILDEINLAAERGDKGYFHLTADKYSACKERGVRGYLDSRTVDEAMARLSEEEKQARGYGEFTYFSQMILPGLSPKLHFVDPEDYPLQTNYLYYVSVNPHEGRETPVIFGCKTPEGRHIIFDELPFDKTRHLWDMTSSPTVKEVSANIKFLEEKYNIRPTRIIDKYMGRQRRGGEGKNLIDKYAEEGLSFIESYSSSSKEGEIAFGHDKMSQLLKILPDGKPGLVIWNTCYHTWDGLSHYIRKRLTTKAGSDLPARAGKIVEKYKLIVDCVRYFVCSSGEATESLPPEKHITHSDMYDYI